MHKIDKLRKSEIFILFRVIWYSTGFPGGTVVKNLPAKAGDTSWILGWWRSPGVGNGNLLQYSHLENSMDRGVWWATAHEGHKK